MEDINFKSLVKKEMDAEFYSPKTNFNYEGARKQQAENELYFADKERIKLLTKRQLECLSLCAHGFSNGKISKLLFISESTVKKTLEETFRKLKATCRTSAVTLAFVFGILNTEILNTIAIRYEIHTQNREDWM